MFTGIVEEVGTLIHVDEGENSSVLHIGAEKVLSDVSLGDSISVNGICLTVTSFSQRHFTVDVMPETIKSTSLRTLQKGESVNLERAVSANGRFGGHFVTGHVDGVGKIKAIRPFDNAVYFDIATPKELLKYIIYKGSIAVDGTSLTVFGVTEETFTISLIPHTLSETILGKKRVGDIVNLECDMIGKYVERFIQIQQHENKSQITEAFLQENGFA